MKPTHLEILMAFIASRKLGEWKTQHTVDSSLILAPTETNAVKVIIRRTADSNQHWRGAIIDVESWAIKQMSPEHAAQLAQHINNAVMIVNYANNLT